MSFRVFACAILFLAGDLNSESLDQKTGPYDVSVKTLESCPDAHKYKITWSRRLSRYNRTTFTYSYPAVLPYDFDDTWSGDVNVAVFGNGGYKDNFYNVHFDEVCTFLENLLPNEIARLVENLKVERFCPLKAGKYNVKNYVVKFGELSGFPSLPYGMFRVETILTKNFENGTKMFMGCSRFIAEVIPKKQ